MFETLFECWLLGCSLRPCIYHASANRPILRPRRDKPPPHKRSSANWFLHILPDNRDVLGRRDIVACIPVHAFIFGIISRQNFSASRQSLSSAHCCRLYRRARALVSSKNQKGLDHASPYRPDRALLQTKGNLESVRTFV